MDSSSGRQKYSLLMVAVSTVYFLRQHNALLSWLRRRLLGIILTTTTTTTSSSLVTAPQTVEPPEIPIAHAVVSTECVEEPPPDPKARGVEPVCPRQCASSRVVSLGADGCERLVAQIREQRRVSWSPDVLVSSGGREFVAHAAVLEATSPVLAEAARRAVRRFKSNEDDDDRRRDLATVRLAGDAESISLVLDFAYGALVTLTEKNVEALLEVASRLRIGTLVDECCAFVAQRTSASRACRVLALADKHKCTLLRRDVGLCVLRHFKLACGLFAAEDSVDREEALGGFLALPRHLLDEILADDRLCVDDESVVFEAAVAWIEARDDRLDQADSVLALVRYYLVGAEFLADAVELHPLMQSRACKDLVHAAYRWQALPPQRRAEKATPVRRSANDQDNNEDASILRGGESSVLHRKPPPWFSQSDDDDDDNTTRRSSVQENPFLAADDVDDHQHPATPTANRQAFV
ncbi:hypothetical protein CTAYLR_001411 [Chrysophaeum taylorii]|uniref:BTB domain-containing protein n=1 Tax=Chrysophaeum taylorii TaxID=2483200 RepID=A0AAD7XJA9_9STRA|nr:hypothetical protein CTAYLR_001411 [Chrysophaeum taylorii]